MRKSIVAADPSQEPLTVSEAKKHLEIASADTTHDSHVGALIQYAREKFELDTGLTTISRSVVEYSENFGDYSIELFHRPIQSITHIKYYSSGTLSTVTAADYSFDSDKRRVVLNDQLAWPIADDRWDAVQITYVAGQASDSTQISELHKYCLKLLIENAFDDRHKDSTSLMTAYENLIKPLMRFSYP